MPLIIITGYPTSGKSFRAAQLQKILENRGKNVHVVSELCFIKLAGFDKNEHYRDSQKEKLVRSNMKSQALRLLNRDDVVILDGANYIKGFRYEIFCASKASRTTQCTLHCAITCEQAWAFNRIKGMENYHKDVFDALCLRYEEPQQQNRWDRPLFTIFPEEELEEENILNALYHQTALAPNLSTQNPPLSSTNYLFEMDNITQDIIARVMSARKLGLVGPVNVNNGSSVDIPSDINASQMNRLRRQFLNYMKQHTTADSKIEKLPSMFVQFINSNFK
ncbi:protein KTI12 homolog [Malaya genurostris]|uniref:protein KTI12 homolog n=1 Tax=Malaya genurostris TaxID=325434 RepID=UPI0026F3DE3D|nr:protein KTI12 homolog [Malaya genurostris]